MPLGAIKELGILLQLLLGLAVHWRLAPLPEGVVPTLQVHEEDPGDDVLEAGQAMQLRHPAVANVLAGQALHDHVKAGLVLGETVLATGALLPLPVAAPERDTPKPRT